MLALLCLTLGGGIAARAVTFSGADSRITYTGRTQKHPNQYSVDGQSVDMGWTGGEARIRFSGSSSIRVIFRGRDGRTPPTAQNTDVLLFLDGKPLRRASGRASVGQDWGGNTLVVRRDGDAYPLLLMEGIILDDGATLLPAPAVNSKRKIKFYGDSVTEQCCTGKQANSTDDVVIATGQNDQFQYDPKTDWYGNLTQQYVAQIEDLRRVYPKAWIICMNTTMTGPNLLSRSGSRN